MRRERHAPRRRLFVAGDGLLQPEAEGGRVVDLLLAALRCFTVLRGAILVGEPVQVA